MLKFIGFNKPNGIVIYCGKGDGLWGYYHDSVDDIYFAYLRPNNGKRLWMIKE
jgi:hypothetical protein